MDAILRKHNRLKKEARRAMLKALNMPEWNNCDITQKTQFISRYEFVDNKKKYVKRSQPRNLVIVKKQLLQRKRRNKRGIRRKAVGSVGKVSLLMCDITNSSDPEFITTELLKSVKRKSIPRRLAEDLLTFFVRPISLTLYKGNTTFIMVTEEEGMYSFEAEDRVIKQLKHNIRTIIKKEGVKAKFKEYSLADDPKHLETAMAVLEL